jgi:hypothetical protein
MLSSPLDILLLCLHQNSFSRRIVIIQRVVILAARFLQEMSTTFRVRSFPIRHNSAIKLILRLFDSHLEGHLLLCHHAHFADSEARCIVGQRSHHRLSVARNRERSRFLLTGAGCRLLVWLLDFVFLCRPHFHASFAVFVAFTLFIVNLI